MVMSWPNNEEWLDSAEAAEAHVLDGGMLLVPSGRILFCDPCYMGASDPRFCRRLDVPPGQYPVRVTYLYDEVAHVSVILGPGPEVSRKVLSSGGPSLPEKIYGEEMPEHTIPIETGEVCVADEEDADSHTPHSMRSHVRPVKPSPVPEGGAESIMIYLTGGDGAMPVVLGYDAGGRLVAAHLDFNRGPLDEEPPED
jgi:hypothetical protein